LQRELPGRVVVDLAFVHTTNYDVLVEDVDLNPIPRQYLTTLNRRDPAADNFLTEQVPNPFRGLLPGTNFNGPTIERQQLLRPFPHFSSLETERYDGQSYYNSAQLRVERRFAQGYTLNVSYTFSKLMEKLSLLNPTDTNFERSIARDDFPHRIVVSGIYELPIGKRRHFLSRTSRLLDLLIGGYQVQGIYQYQSGRPFNLGNLAYFGNPALLRANINSSTVGGLNRVFDISGFTSPGGDIRLRNNIRTFPSHLSGLRAQPISQVDFSLIKNFNLTERTRMQLRAEFLNATNTPMFGEPNLDPTNANFGRVTSQVNLARNVQIGLRLTF
jgi:hypothetical protein